MDRGLDHLIDDGLMQYDSHNGFIVRVTESEQKVDGKSIGFWRFIHLLFHVRFNSI